MTEILNTHTHIIFYHLESLLHQQEVQKIFIHLFNCVLRPYPRGSIRPVGEQEVVLDLKEFIGYFEFFS